YEGDFWGVYLAIEQEDGRFLDEHDLPDGNLYKMEGGTGELNNLGDAGPADKSDLNRFLSEYNSASDAWWRSNLNLPSYYSYQSIVQAIHHYDICYDKNFFYFLNPETRLWEVMSWDLDLTWAENMFDAGCGGVDRIHSRLLNPSTRPQLYTEYRNRIREVRDLLWNTEQAWQLIDEFARLLRGTNSTARTLLDADRAQWDYNPKMSDSRYTDNPSSKAGQGRYYRWPNEPAVSKDFNGCVQLMKNYVTFRASNTGARAAPLDSIARDPAIPLKPQISYAGPNGHPVNALRFRSSAFSGTGGFKSMKWRLGEISRPDAPSFDPTEPFHYEIEPVWESAELTTFESEIAVPAGVARVGHVYRARVRFMDTAGRTSHWSDPFEFVAGEPDNATALRNHLRISEIMYNPPAGSDFEFIELYNNSSSEFLDLTGVKFTAGIDFTFPPGTTLGWGTHLLVVKASSANNFAAFRQHYGLSENVPIVGPFSGSLSNDGERITLRTAAAGTDIVSFTYGDGIGWPVAADGAGHSLTPTGQEPAIATAGAYLDWPFAWKGSGVNGGTPGRQDPSVPSAVIINEIMAHTDYSNPARPEYDSNDWIELHNLADSPRAIGGWYLSD
ncbi:MAG: lamin tail domain-containing protein, partial [Verrucomicrobiota bacterium]